ncbi:MAG: DegV family protein [Clostridiales bacterium]|nr:DegV family protein [Clostridiales bacterium]
MSTYLLYTDSAADIPSHYYQEYDIRIVAMDYMVDGESCTFLTEDPDHDPICDRLYKKMRSGADVHTSQITPYRYIETWTPELKAGHDILYLSFSSGMSATYQNALNAASQLADEFPDRRIAVVDSLAATAGQGVITVCAAMNRQNGMTLDENAAWLKEKIPYLCHRFTVGDLDYLHKGGRVSAAVALIGGMLNIKPLLIIDEDGKLQMTGKARGVNSALKALTHSYQHEMHAPGVPDLVFISHTSKYEKAEELARMIREADPDATVETVCETPIIGVHTGPEFFSVCGFGRHRTESKS